jgi:tetrahydromethanopterin S-methyltransferase subunit D
MLKGTSTTRVRRTPTLCATGYEYVHNATIRSAVGLNSIRNGEDNASQATSTTLAKSTAALAAEDGVAGSGAAALMVTVVGDARAANVLRKNTTLLLSKEK